MGPKPNDKCPYERSKGQPYKDRGGDWRDPATSQGRWGPQEAEEAGRPSPGVLGGRRGLTATWFWTSASRTGRDTFLSVVFSHQVSGNLLGQP